MKQVILSFLLLVTLAFSQAYAERDPLIIWQYRVDALGEYNESVRDTIRTYVFLSNQEVSRASLAYLIEKEKDKDKEFLASLLLEVLQNRRITNKNYAINSLIEVDVYNDAIKEQLVVLLSSPRINVAKNAFNVLLTYEKEDHEFLEEVFYKVLTGSTEISSKILYKQIKETGIYSERIKEFLLTQKHSGITDLDILLTFESDKEEFLTDVINQTHYSISDSMRSSAIKYLSHQGIYSEKVKEALLHALKSDDYHVFRFAIDSLIKHEPDKELVSSLLLKKIENPNIRISTYVISKIGDLGIYTKEVKDRLITLLEHPDDEIVRWAIYALTSLEADKQYLTNILLDKTTFETDSVEYYARRALEKIGVQEELHDLLTHRRTSQKLEVYNDTIRDALIQDIYGSDRDAARSFNILVANEPDIEFIALSLLKAIEHDNPKFKNRAVKYLGRIGFYDSRIKTVLLSHLEGLDPHKKYEETGFRSKNYEYNLIRYSINSLVTLEPDKESLISLLITFLEFKDSAIRKIAFNNLSTLGIYNREIKAVILSALAKGFLGSDAIDLLRSHEADTETLFLELLQHEDWNVRNKALREIKYGDDIYSPKIKAVLLKTIEQEHVRAIELFSRFETDKEYVTSLLLKKLQHKNSHIRNKARDTLVYSVKLYNQEVKEELLSLLTHHDIEIIKVAVYVLAGLEPDKEFVIQTLTNILESRHNFGDFHQYIQEIINNGGKNMERQGGKLMIQVFVN